MHRGDVPLEPPGRYSEKAALYLEAGARESWILHQDFTLRLIAAGQRIAPSQVDLARVRSELQAL